MADDPRQPLLSCSERQGKVSYVREQSGKDDTSLRKLGAVEDESEVTVTGSEVRAAAFMHTSDFWMQDSTIPTGDYLKLVGKEGLDSRSEEHGQFILDEVMKSVQALEEEEIRDLLFDHFGSNCCWYNKNASKWSIQKIEDCNSYIGTLETFIEERDVVDEVQPFVDGNFDDRDKGKVPDAWDMDMKSEMPLLFISEKVARRKIPNSQVVRVCEGCLGCGKLAYNGSKPKRESRHQLHNCEGLQRSRKCELCCGQGALLHSKVLVVRWKTVVLKRVCATKNAKSVPDEVFHRAKGVQLYQNQSYQCEPACFPNSNGLNKFSEFIISERNSIPDSGRIICERHRISLMPVTRVVMAYRNKSLKLYILGLSKEVYVPARSLSFCGICNIC